MSLDDVAKVTKIQPRILERLESGQPEGLPAEVFVRGFVRSFARCVGLDEGEALRRYAACGTGSQDLTPTVRALVEVMADLAPGSASAARATPRKMQAVEVAVEVIDLAAPAMPAADEPADGTARSVACEPPAAAAIEPASAAPIETVEVVEAGAAACDAPAGDAIAPVEAVEASAASQDATCDAVAPSGVRTEPSSSNSSKKKRGRRRKARAAAREARSAGVSRESLAVGTPPSASPVVAPPAQDAPDDAAPPWTPRMPAGVAPSVPWRRSGQGIAAMPVIAAPATPAPSLVIDDADPESAERVLEERAENLSPRRSFLPPILLDREDRSARQGGLTLAVILLLIAATLTLSYLMRRPSAGGDGVTVRAALIDRIG